MGTGFPLRERLRFAVPTSLLNVRVEITGQDGFLQPLFHWEAVRETAKSGSFRGLTVGVVRRPHPHGHEKAEGSAK